MPQHPDADQAAWDELDHVLAAIAARNEQLRRDINEHVAELTLLHHRADQLRADLGINEVTVDTAPVRHLRSVS